MKMSMDELNGICMEMIGNAGEGRAKVYEALESFHKKEWEHARDCLDEAQELLGQAHKIQFEKLMGPQSSGTELPFSMLLLHAMDMAMAATSEHDLLRSFVNAEIEKKEQER